MKSVIPGNHPGNDVLFEIICFNSNTLCSFIILKIYAVPPVGVLNSCKKVFLQRMLSFSQIEGNYFPP